MHIQNSLQKLVHMCPPFIKKISERLRKSSSLADTAQCLDCSVIESGISSMSHHLLKHFRNAVCFKVNYSLGDKAAVNW